jgi:hypothetical protein
MVRLLKEGMVRHDVLHAIGRVLTGRLFTVLKENGPFDMEGYSRDLRQLDRASWEAAGRELPSRPKVSRNERKRRDKERRGKAKGKRG